MHYTWEAIVAATMLYVNAYNLLGERPENLGKLPDPKPMSFADIAAKYGNDIPQFFLDLEDEDPADGANMTFSPMNAFDVYFCIPENNDFIAYWDRVEDRLYKIRHGLNIKGIPQTLALFEPPIDPMQLVRAAAAGGDVLASVLKSDLALPYRFGQILERARTLASTAAGLGNALLAALEKKDGEDVARLRATHEKALLNLTTLMKQKQIEEIDNGVAALQEAKSAAQKRFDFYKAAYEEKISNLELADFTLRAETLPFQVASVATRGLAIGGYLTPDIFGLADGGMQFGDAINSVTGILEGVSGILNQTAGLVATSAQYERRKDDWGLQRDIAQHDIDQFDKQITSNQARAALLRRELETHQKSIEQQDEYEAFLKRKFTNSELYQWMVGRLSTLHFQTYQLARDMAFAAQAAYQFELDSIDEFIFFDYWDSMRQGLLAGDALLLALNQMEAAYLKANSRSLEIEKTISLLHLDPVAFMKFKGGIDGAEKGKLTFSLKERLFDFDFPGHYSRKIKSISATIPAVIGPYQNINATLVQNANSIVVKPQLDAVRHLIDGTTTAPDGSLRTNLRPSQQIALSRGVDDTGMFVLDFRDDRYLPFEGTGAVSDWTLNLPPETNRIDFGSISDVIIKIQYTAKDGSGDGLSGVKGLLRADQAPYPYQPAKIFDLKQAFASDWSIFLNQPPQGGVQQIAFPLGDPMVLPNLQNVNLLAADVLLLTSDGTKVSDKGDGTHFVSIKLGDSAKAVPMTNNTGHQDLSDIATPGKTCSLVFTVDNAPDGLKANGVINPAVLSDVIVVITYQSNVFNKPVQLSSQSAQQR